MQKTRYQNFHFIYTLINKHDRSLTCFLVFLYAYFHVIPRFNIHIKYIVRFVGKSKQIQNCFQAYSRFNWYSGRGCFLDFTEGIPKEFRGTRRRVQKASKRDKIMNTRTINMGGPNLKSMPFYIEQVACSGVNTGLKMATSVVGCNA